MDAFNWPIRVYYEDTDAGGVVYHARYLAFFERARTEMLRQYNINQQSLLEEHNLVFVVKKMSIDYIYPARLDDSLIVISSIKNMRKASVLFEQKIIDRDNQLHCTAEVLIACVDLNKKKPCVLPDVFISGFLKRKI